MGLPKPLCIRATATQGCAATSAAHCIAVPIAVAVLTRRRVPVPASRNRCGRLPGAARRARDQGEGTDAERYRPHGAFLLLTRARSAREGPLFIQEEVRLRRR